MSITLLTDDQAREIADDAARKAVELALESFNSTPEIMTQKEVAEFLRCSVPTIRNKILHNGFPVSYQIGSKAPRFVRSEVLEWLKHKS